MKEPSGLAFASVPAKFVKRIRQRKQPVQRRSQHTTEVLLEATLQVLRRDGYAALTTTRVAERAGVSVGTLYQYFPDKRSLVTALKVQYFEAMVGSVRAAALEVVGAPLEVAFRRMLGALLRVKRDNLELSLALRAPMAELGEDGFVRETSRAFIGVVCQFLEHAAPRVKERERRATMLVAALEGVISAAVFESPQWLSAEWFLDELLMLGLGYLRAARD